MSKLDDILVPTRPIYESRSYPELKQQIKDLMREIYNKALQAYIIDKTASSLDEAFDKVVNEL